MIWIAVASALIAVAAAYYTYRTARSSRNAPLWMPPPRARRGSPLAFTVLDADVRLGSPGDAGHYAFLLSIVNDSGIPRTFTGLDLRVRYRTAAQFSGAVDVPMSSSLDPGGSRTGEVTLRLPLALNARQSVIGWAHFTAADVIPRDCRVDGYAIAIRGSAGEQLLAEAQLATVIEGGSARTAAG